VPRRRQQQQRQDWQRQTIEAVTDVGGAYLSPTDDWQ